MFKDVKWLFIGASACFLLAWGLDEPCYSAAGVVLIYLGLAATDKEPK